MEMKQYDMSDMPEVIYHYCNLNVFNEIIKSKKIRLSDSEKTNDSLENVYLYKVLEEIIEKENDIYKNYLEPIDIPFHSYITCFSTNGDLLSQWRAYAEDGMGISIGFNMEYLKKLKRHMMYKKKCEEFEKEIDELCNEIEKEYSDEIKKIREKVKQNSYDITLDKEIEKIYKKINNKNKEKLMEKWKEIKEMHNNKDNNLPYLLYDTPFIIAKVLYNKKEQKEFIKSIINEKEEDGNKDDEEWHKKYSLKLGSYSMKGEGFQEESEIRIITFPMVLRSNTAMMNDFFDINFVALKDDIKSYFELDFSIIIKDESGNRIPPIKEIFIGPKSKLDERTVKAMFDKYGLVEYKDIKISRSITSYR